MWVTGSAQDLIAACTCTHNQQRQHMSGYTTVASCEPQLTTCICQHVWHACCCWSAIQVHVGHRTTKDTTCTCRAEHNSGNTCLAAYIHARLATKTHSPLWESRGLHCWTAFNCMLLSALLLKTAVSHMHIES